MTVRQHPLQFWVVILPIISVPAFAEDQWTLIDCGHLVDVEKERIIDSYQPAS